MKQLELLSKKQKIILVGIGIFIISIIVFYFYTKYQTAEYVSEEIEEKIESIDEMNTISENIDETQIIIHISGAVLKEGIVKINKGARISDVIELAGGLQENASLKNVNLAYRVEDGQKIYIPTKEEEKEQETENEYVIVEEGNNSTKNSKKEENAKMNINKATQTELEELPGIGSSTALKIIQYREENGNFQTIEDIKKVNGIGDAKFNHIKEYITV